MASWVLSAEAQSDLRGIRRYTEQTWGPDQAGIYRAQLFQCAARIAADPGCGKDLADFKLGLRMLRCQHHYIFCVFDAAASPLIVAILHERMDLMGRIGERLS